MLTAQLAFVHQLQGDGGKAMKTYTALFNFKTELDPVVAAVAGNNIVALRGGKSGQLFDSWKKCRANLSEALAKKATPRQRHAFLFNAALLSMHMNKPEQCAELLTQLAASFPESDAPALIRAAQLIRSKAPQQAVEALEAAAAAMPTSSRALLALAQLQLEAKETGRAIATLERIGSLARTPAMIGTLVALHERLGAVDAAAAAFGDGETREPMLRAAADFAARHGMWERAAAAQQKLLDANSRDLQALAGLVIATSHFDSEGANELNARLELAAPPGDDDAEMEDDDAERLEQAALPKKGKAAPADRKRGAAGEEESAEPRRRKKRRKKKPLYPKGFDPENPPLVGPDPERWLPKHERSTYRKTKKEKRAGIRGPQGSATGAARVDARATTNVKELSADEKAKIKAQEEVNERKEAAAAAAGGGVDGRRQEEEGQGQCEVVSAGLRYKPADRPKLLYLDALDHELGVRLARRDQLHVQHVVGVGARRRAVEARAPARRFLVVPGLVVPQDQPLPLRRGVGALDEPALVPQRVERRPPRVLPHQQVVALEQHELVVALQLDAAGHRVAQLARVGGQRPLAGALGGAELRKAVVGVKGPRRAAPRQKFGRVGRVERAELRAAVVEAVHRQHHARGRLRQAERRVDARGDRVRQGRLAGARAAADRNPVRFHRREPDRARRASHEMAVEHPS